MVIDWGKSPFKTQPLKMQASIYTKLWLKGWIGALSWKIKNLEKH